MAKQKLRKYELIYLVQPEAGDEDRTKVADRVSAVIEQFEGRVLENEDWGKRKLSYEIRKFNKAYYTYLVLVGPSGMTQEIERILRMLDHCIRFMTIKLADGIDPDSLPAEGEGDEEERAEPEVEPVVEAAEVEELADEAEEAPSAEEN